MLSTGKQIKLYGTSLAIGKSLDIGEGPEPNIFMLGQQLIPDQQVSQTVNLFQLTREEIMEVADFTIQLWMDMKSNIRKYGETDVKIFN